MELTEQKLVKENIRYTNNEGNLYFYVEDIKKKYKDLKFPANKIKQFLIQGVHINTIRLRDIQEMTEFDKKILQTLNFNPRNK